MNWLWMLIGIIILLFLVKIFLKTMKLFFVFVLVAAVVIIYIMWQHGLILR